MEIHEAHQCFFFFFFLAYHEFRTISETCKSKLENLITQGIHPSKFDQSNHTPLIQPDYFLKLEEFKGLIEDLHFEFQSNLDQLLNQALIKLNSPIVVSADETRDEL